MAWPWEHQSQETSHSTEIWKLVWDINPCGPVDGMDPVTVAKEMSKAIDSRQSGGWSNFSGNEKP